MEETPSRKYLVEAAAAIQTEVEAGNYSTAREWAFVFEWQYRLLSNSGGGETVSDARAELVDRLAWALYDAAVGYGNRVADDLERVEALAAEVQNPD